MTKIKRLLALGLALALGVSLFAGCSKSGDGSSSSGASSSAVEVQPMDLTGVTDPYLATAGLAGDTVVAKVGDYEITADSLIYWLNYNISYTLQQYSAYGMTELPWDSDAGGVTMEQSMLYTSLQLAAYYRLLPEIGAGEGLAIPQDTQDAIAAELQLIRDDLGSEELTEHYFWMQMMTSDLYQEMCRAGEMNALLQQKYYGEGSEGYPTDAEVLAFAKDRMGIYRVKHILLSNKNVETQEALDEAAVAQKKAQADDLLAQLRAAEDPIALFDQLMNEHSEDPGLAAHPDGYEAYKGQMVPEFEEASLALEDGQISEVVESDHGYHIILRLPLDPADYRAEMVSRLMEEKSVQWLEDYGIETLEPYEQIDPSNFRALADQLQLGAYQEIQAVVDAKNADAASSAAGSEG